MTIRTRPATIFIAEDGTEYTTRKDAAEHSFRLAVRKWCAANCYFGMSEDEIAQAMIEDKVRLAAIFREFMI